MSSETGGRDVDSRGSDGPPPAPYEFSPVLGGPLFQLVRRAHLSGDALELWRQRVIAITLFAWGPLLLLSVLGGRAWGSSEHLPFLLDVGIHVRLLLALPLLIGAELIVHRRLHLVAGQFMERGLVAPASRYRFDAALASAIRWRDSVVAELVLVAVVYGASILVIWPQFRLMNANVSSWYADSVGAGMHLTAAGIWRTYVSLPLFQFMMLRWYYRIFVWVRLLWQVSRCELKLMATHPDRVGGLGFLSLTPMAFAPLLTAHGAALAGLIANLIFFHGDRLPDFKYEIVAVVAFLLLLVLAPLLFFVFKLAATKRTGLREYGNLAQRYVRQFDDKWLRGGAPPGESLVGSPDIQSLADLGNSFEFVRSMKLAPITRDAVLQLLIFTLAPLAPLMLTMLPLEELMQALVKVLL
jgi:hypothetical protein